MDNGFDSLTRAYPKGGTTDTVSTAPYDKYHAAGN
jgi:hypothetical protein